MVDTALPGHNLSGENLRIGIVVARFNSAITDDLLAGATETLRRYGVAATDVTVVRVPGAFEIPLAAKALARTERYDGLVALGAVIRGDTPHFDYVAGECARGISRVGLEYTIPIAFGVLTVNTLEQAVERSGTKAGNKGVDAAMAVLEMIHVLRELDG